MGACWNALRASLVQSASTLKSDLKFKMVKPNEPTLARFESPMGLIQHLSSELGDLDEKDAIYAVLVRTVQARDAWADLAKVVLWLGLWPGLDHIYRRRLHHFKDEPDEIVEAIAVAFTELIEQMDLGKVKRIAANLVLGTRRDLLEERRREQIHHDALCEDDVPEPETPPLRDSDLGLPVSISFDEQMGALRAYLLPVGGADTDLFLAVVVLDESPREAAERMRMGLTPAAGQKRVQRVRERVRTHLEKKLSQSVGETRVSGESRPRGQRREEE